ncbi:MAG: type III secretion system chaperone [Puniceicoccales bacterium]|jgi:hypothetical protein|nr:type III secretion system chaperone [Puniceicoccales bacterium]
MRSREVVALIASELGLFDLHGGSDEYYAVRLPDGGIMRIFVQAETAVILERQLMTDVTAALRNPDRLLALLQENFSRAIDSQSTLSYARDADELVLSVYLPYESWDEQKLVEILDAFLLEASQMHGKVETLLLMSSSRLPSNNHRISTP